MQPNQINDYVTDNTNVPWSMDTIDNFLDTPMNNPMENGRVETCGGVMASQDHDRRTDWHEWADQLIGTNDDTHSNLSDILIDVNVPELDSKLLEFPPEIPNFYPQIHHHQQQFPVPTVQGCPVVGSPAAPSSKARMRWTPELHEVFLDAMNKLGGCERATPKSVMKLMNVEGLTIYHVKSHLQKYRTARFKPESSEETSEKKSNSSAKMTTLDLKTTMGITEALKLQMEVQKQLHEQLEIQRNMQLRIEEQGKHLQMIFEQQRKMGGDKLKAAASSSNTDELNLPSSAERQASICNGNTESLENDPSTIEQVPGEVCTSGDEHSNRNGKSSEREPSVGHGPDVNEFSTPSKRAKADCSGTS